MNTRFCPLALDWGSVADWVAVVVAVASVGVAVVAALIALVGAAAVGYLAWQANVQVTRSDNENIKALGRESDLLTLVFEPELVLLIPHLEGTITYLQRESETYERSLKMRQMVAASLEQLALPEITTHFARLHVLPPNFGYGLSRLKGGLSALQVAARVWKEGGDESEAKEFGKMIVQACQTLLRNAEELVDIARARRIAVMAE